MSSASKIIARGPFLIFGILPNSVMIVFILLIRFLSNIPFIVAFASLTRISFLSALILDTASFISEGVFALSILFFSSELRVPNLVLALTFCCAKEIPLSPSPQETTTATGVAIVAIVPKLNNIFFIENSFY